MFPSGWVALQFKPELRGIKTVYTYQSIDDVVVLHGHGDKTEIVWVDEQDYTC